MVLCVILLHSMAECDVNFTNASSLGPLSTVSEDYGRIILTPLVLDSSHSVNIVGLSLSLSSTPVSERTLCGVILTDSSGNIVAVVQHTSEWVSHAANTCCHECMQWAPVLSLCPSQSKPPPYIVCTTGRYMDCCCISSNNFPLMTFHLLPVSGYVYSLDHHWFGSW